MSVSFNVTTIPMIAGSVLSLLFSYVPGVESRYGDLSAGAKRLLMLILILLVSISIYGLGCAGLIQTDVVCSKDGLVQAVNIFFAVLIANQGTFLLTAKSAAPPEATE